MKIRFTEYTELCKAYDVKALKWIFYYGTGTGDEKHQYVPDNKELRGCIPYFNKLGMTHFKVEQIQVIPDNEYEPMQIEFTRINSDTFGNPRYVCHYLNFFRSDESGSKSYETALYRAKKLGGRKFHNKQYGGGIVFQSYNIDDLKRKIHELLKNIL